MKKFLDYFLYQLGIIVIPKSRLNDFLIIRRLKKVVRKYNIDCIVDVGANIGQYGRFLRKQVGYQGLIISFEPDPENFEKLTAASRADSMWIVESYALGKENSKLELNIMANSEFNSFLEPDNSQTDSYKDLNLVKARIEVPVKRLDEVLPQFSQLHQFENVFLKLDTQGFDLDVFRGAAGCIRLISGIQTEVSVLPIYANMPSFEDSLNLFRANNFEVSGLYAVSESRFPHAFEFDCIYLPKNN